MNGEREIFVLDNSKTIEENIYWTVCHCAKLEQFFEAINKFVYHMLFTGN